MMPIVTSAVRRGQQRKEDSANSSLSSSSSLAGSVAADARGRNVYNLP